MPTETPGFQGSDFQGSDFYEAWHWLSAHPAFVAKGRKAGRKDDTLGEIKGDFWEAFGVKTGDIYDSRIQRFSEALDIGVAMVDPITHRIDSDVLSRNTRTEVWLECGAYDDPMTPEHETARNEGHYSDQWLDYGIPTHDYRLDCGAATFEEAILKLAALVKEHYGDYDEKDGVN